MSRPSMNLPTAFAIVIFAICGVSALYVIPKLIYEEVVNTIERPERERKHAERVKEMDELYRQMNPDNLTPEQIIDAMRKSGALENMAKQNGFPQGNSK
jgi:hypothetical protein